jgi:hypothetical protein
MIKQLIFTLLSIAVMQTGALAADDYWLHVRISEDEHGGEQIKINMPIRLVETMLPMIETPELREGRIKIEDSEFTGDDLRKIWQALRDSDDGEFLTIETNDESVRVAKEDGLLKIEMRDLDDEGNFADIQIPLKVVDALLSGDDDELDLLAGLQALQKPGHEIRVTINDDHAAVLIWVDESSKGDR